MKPSFMPVTPSPIGNWEVGDIADVGGERLLVVSVTGNGLMVIPERSRRGRGCLYWPAILLADFAFWFGVALVALALLGGLR